VTQDQQLGLQFAVQNHVFHYVLGEQHAKGVVKHVLEVQPRGVSDQSGFHKSVGQHLVAQIRLLLKGNRVLGGVESEGSAGEIDPDGHRLSLVVG